MGNRYYGSKKKFGGIKWNGQLNVVTDVTKTGQKRKSKPSKIIWPNLLGTHTIMLSQKLVS